MNVFHCRPSRLAYARKRMSQPVQAVRRPVGRPRRYVDANRVRDLRRQGFSFRKIAHIMGFGDGTVRRAYLSKLGEFRGWEATSPADLDITTHRRPSEPKSKSAARAPPGVRGYHVMLPDLSEPKLYWRTIGNVYVTTTMASLSFPVTTFWPTSRDHRFPVEAPIIHSRDGRYVAHSFT
jgi:hypothetical protein